MYMSKVETSESVPLPMPIDETERMMDVEEFLTQKAKKLRNIDLPTLISKVQSGMAENMTQLEILVYMGEVCATLITKHPEYGKLAAICELEYLYLNSADTFSDAMFEASKYIKMCPEFLKFVDDNKEVLNAEIDNEKDSLLEYFGIKTLTKNFVLDSGSRTYERPQYMFLRVACQINMNDLQSVLETYRLMSSKYFTHATPTMMRSGKKLHQMSSCFLMGSKDSVSGFSNTIRKISQIAKSGGGVAIHVSNYSTKSTLFKQTNHKSCGIIPKLRTYNEVTRCITQSNNRRGSTAIYIEPWHPEIKIFVELRKNTGAEDQRARDLFQALWVSDLFMKRVINDEDWSLFCPFKCPGLDVTYGDEFEALYKKYEAEGAANEVMKARSLWKEIINAQIETGNPFIMYKDHVNRKSNHKNIGIIKSSNLCTEIVQYSDENEVAVCNLASLGLPAFVENIDESGNNEKCSGWNKKLDTFFKKQAPIDRNILKVKNLNKRTIGNGKFLNLEKIYQVAKHVIRNLNNVIDMTYYPIPEARASNMKLRPTGLGIQGLADVFVMMHLPFESQEAINLNRDISETIYYAALEASCELAKIHGPYERFEGSPISQGILAFDYEKVEPELFNFNTLKEKIAKYGIRNSHCIALMPTATTSILFGNTESFEAISGNIYAQRTLSGDFQVVNKYLLKDLIDLGLWNDELKNLLIYKKGSIQEIPDIPENIKKVYKTIWEVSKKHYINMAYDRSHYVCQSQSMNIFLKSPTHSVMSAIHIYGWKKGLKTGMYYLRTMPIGSAIQFTVNRDEAKKKLKSRSYEESSSNMDNSCSLIDDCMSCGA